MIEKFLSDSEGLWRSMRSGHSLAFQQFEEIVSYIKISYIDIEDDHVDLIVKGSEFDKDEIICPFQVEWNAESNWNIDTKSNKSSGISTLIPIPKTATDGFILRDVGYAEKVKGVSEYSFLNDGTMLLTTYYENTIAEERIWFLSQNVRCRSSVIRTDKESGILQTSFASEIKISSKS